MLRGYTLGANDLELLRRRVAAGELKTDSFAELIAMLEDNRSRPGATLVVEAMLARPIGDRRLLLRLHALRGAAPVR